MTTRCEHCGTETRLPQDHTLLECRDALKAQRDDAVREREASDIISRAVAQSAAEWKRSREASDRMGQGYAIERNQAFVERDAAFAKGREACLPLLLLLRERLGLLREASFFEARVATVRKALDDIDGYERDLMKC